MGYLLKNISRWKILAIVEIFFFFLGKQFDFHQVGNFIVFGVSKGMREGSWSGLWVVNREVKKRGSMVFPSCIH